jgi:beta-glucosidase
MIRIKHLFILALLLSSLTPCAQTKEQFVNDLLLKMTLKEKIGQLNQYTSDGMATGKITVDSTKASQIKNGEVGSMLNVIGADETRQMQEIAMQSRLKIPMVFGLDVIHGFRTTFPVPLGEAASWDLNLMEKTARIAAIEASAYGIHWTFAPMVDVARDPRWGRVMEGAGEDTFFGSLVASARVRGFQGDGLADSTSIMACAKHFAAYGAAIGGRDYNSVDMSLRQLNETYLPPFKAAVEANAATFMTSFNDINGIPASANHYVLRNKLKGEWDFKGFVVSDWGSIAEMINHGYVANKSDAALKSMLAGCDMDMEGRCYSSSLKQLVEKGQISISVIDDAVRRILTKKYELGLFEDPYRYCNNKREKQQTNNAYNRSVAHEAGEKSIVLLKNDNQLLPLSKNVKNIALIGPFIKATTANHGFWSLSFPDDDKRIVTQYDGIRKQLDKSANLLYAKGCNINDNDTSGFSEAIKIAMQADIVVLSLGEAPDMSGEAKSRSNIHFPGVQNELLKAIYATGKPVVLMINAGRPLVFNWASDHIPAILYTWWLGTEAGNSIADVLFGTCNPSGKLPMSFPRTEGQIPIYYNHYNTGRPARDENDKNYVSAYIDLPNSPKYPFGYGLSYSTFDFSDLKLSTKEISISANDSLLLSINVTNSGKYDGEEVIQLYIRDLVGCVVRPVKELKGFRKIFLKQGETRTVRFKLTPQNLKFYNNQLNYINEAGEYELYIGNSSLANIKQTFSLTK